MTKWSPAPAHPSVSRELRRETLEEIRLYELRHGEAISQAELAGRLDVTQGAISKLEHSEDVRVSTLRQYLEALGARLELVAVFDDEDRRVPVHLGKDSAACSSAPVTGTSAHGAPITGRASVYFIAYDLRRDLCIALLIWRASVISRSRAAYVGPLDGSSTRRGLDGSMNQEQQCGIEDLEPGDVALGLTFVVERDEMVEFAAVGT